MMYSSTDNVARSISKDLYLFLRFKNYYDRIFFLMFSNKLAGEREYFVAYNFWLWYIILYSHLWNQRDKIIMSSFRSSDKFPSIQNFWRDFNFLSLHFPFKIFIYYTVIFYKQHGLFNVLIIMLNKRWFSALFFYVQYVRKCQRVS